MLRCTEPLTASTMASSMASGVGAAAALRSSSGARYIERWKTHHAAARTTISATDTSAASLPVRRRVT